ncbi:MAG: zinc ribbon domain-containing protein [Chloroflexi bacterium CFX4]|nr:zinc ribbon domain-containing protein [Chloroflexi bacterium CFX4]MDL1921291.1 zinc ribbon domain-containing protein [Chloroflexi bacterium CFX3]
MFLEDTVSGFLLFLATALGAAVTALWAGMALWTWRDIRARSRDGLAHGAATLLVALLNVFGLLVYLMLRPRETLAEAYERSLEEEALLQGIEEKPMCPGCGRPSQTDWQVCPYCHTRLRKPCVQCNQLLELAWTLCPYCATVQVAESAPRPRRRGAPQPAPLEYIEGEGDLE